MLQIHPTCADLLFIDKHWFQSHHLCVVVVVVVCAEAAIGSMALDMAHSTGDKQLQYYGMDVLTVAVLAIMITAPIGALAIGLTGPKLLQKYTSTHQDTNTLGEKVSRL